MLASLFPNLLTPPQPNLGEAFMLHQTLQAFYFLRAKSVLYEAHCESEELKHWWHVARTKAFEPYIEELTSMMSSLGLPLPPSLPELTDLTDQFMALDAAAMVKGMLEANAQGLQVARRPDVALFYHKVLDGALAAGTQLSPLLERQGWVGFTPPYPSDTTH